MLPVLENEFVVCGTITIGKKNQMYENVNRAKIINISEIEKITQAATRIEMIPQIVCVFQYRAQKTNFSYNFL